MYKRQQEDDGWSLPDGADRGWADALDGDDSDVEPEEPVVPMGMSRRERRERSQREAVDAFEGGAEMDEKNRLNLETVSYTHLDVYKRQRRRCSRPMPKWCPTWTARSKLRLWTGE